PPGVLKRIRILVATLGNIVFDQGSCTIYSSFVSSDENIVRALLSAISKSLIKPVDIKPVEIALTLDDTGSKITLSKARIYRLIERILEEIQIGSRILPF